MSGGITLDEPSPHLGLPALRNAPLMAPVFHDKKACMVISLADPSPDDLDTFRDGRIDVAARVFDDEDMAFLNWKFTPAEGPSFYVSTAVHVLLMDMPQEHDPKDILGTGEDDTVLLLVQDERPYFRVLRIVSMPPAVADYLTPVLTRQLGHWRLPRHEIVRRRNVSTLRYLTQFADQAKAFETAPVKGWAW